MPHALSNSAYGCRLSTRSQMALIDAVMGTASRSPQGPHNQPRRAGSRTPRREPDGTGLQKTRQRSAGHDERGSNDGDGEQHRGKHRPHAGFFDAERIERRQHRAADSSADDHARQQEPMRCWRRIRVPSPPAACATMDQVLVSALVTLEPPRVRRQAGRLSPRLCCIDSERSADAVKQKTSAARRSGDGYGRASSSTGRPRGYPQAASVDPAEGMRLHHQPYLQLRRERQCGHGADGQMYFEQMTGVDHRHH